MVSLVRVLFVFWYARLSVRVVPARPIAHKLIVFPLQSCAGEMLMTMLNTCVSKLENLAELVPVLVASGRRHAGYRVEHRHYEGVGTALLWTLEHLLGDAWTEEAKVAWIWVFGIIVECVHVHLCHWCHICVCVHARMLKRSTNENTETYRKLQKHRKNEIKN